MDLTLYCGLSDLIQKLGMEKTADWAVEHGFSSVEPLDLLGKTDQVTFETPEQAGEFRKILEDRGLNCACYSVGVDLYHSAENVEKLQQRVEVAAALGSPYLHHTLVPSLVREPDMPPIDEVAETVVPRMVEVAKYAEDLGLRCLYEPQGMYANGLRGFARFYEAIRVLCPQVGVCGDVGNTLFVDESPQDFFEKYAADIRHVHVKDYLFRWSVTSPGLYWMRTQGGNWLRDTMVDNGVVPLAGCLSALRMAEYRGAFSLELCHPEPFEAGVQQGTDAMRRFWTEEGL